MNKKLLALGLAALAAGTAHAQTPFFQPGNLAVLRLGDGGTNRCLPLNGGSVAIPYTNYFASDIAGSRQTQLFIDQFDPNGLSQTIPMVQVAVPTNGPAGLFINGNAGTEGSVTLAGDRSALAVTGYAGDILSITTGQQTAPSNLSYDRGIGSINAFGQYSSVYRGGGWYGIATGKTNPRGVATDGAGSFWGCGNGYGSLYFNGVNAPDPIQFQNIALTSASKVINNTLYASVKNAESVNLYPAGIYSFVDFFNNPVPFPTAASFLRLEIPAQAPYVNCIGFDINPQKTVAYVTDASTTGGGIQKYVRSGLSWKLAYNLSIPGYYNLSSGILTNAASTNVLVGAFSVAVDWSGTNPVVYATTTDSGWAIGNPYYGNRVIRLNDTNTIATGTNIVVTTNMNILTTVARPGLDANGIQITNVIYKSVTFTPDLRPVITTNPENKSVVVGGSASFAVVASSPYAMGYQWLSNGTNLTGRTSPSLTLNSVALADDASILRCVVSNIYGAVTSSVATLAVSPTAIAPTLGAAQNITNFVGNSQSITPTISGSDPKSGYRWYLNGAPLSDGPTGNGSTLDGTATRTLGITQMAFVDAGAYSLAVSNIAGSASNVVANLYTAYAPPVMIQPPPAITTFFGGTVSNTASAYGSLLTYRWYVSTKTNLTGTTLTALADAARLSGTATPTLRISPVGNVDSTNYVVVVTNPGGSITSAPAPMTIVVAPPHTFIAYTNGSQNYLQNFNSLPIPGGSSAEGANPIHITYVMTNVAQMLINAPYASAGLAAELQYSTDNPMDLGYPILPSGGIGLLGKMDGWYGWAQKALVFAATKGDQSQGAVVDNGGNYYADGSPLTGITNRSLGIVATTKSGPVAFGAAVVNKSATAFNRINLAFTGALWRNNPSQQPLVFGYFIDTAGTNSTFHPDLWDATNGIRYVNSLDVNFAPSATTQILDGTFASNQVSRSVSGLSIPNWTPGSALWLIWQGQILGSAQNVAIDDLAFSVIAAPTATSLGASNVSFTSATLNGSVGSGGQATTCYFEFGTTTGYGIFSATNSLAAGSNAVVTVSRTGLIPATAYHYRVVASNADGTIIGGDSTFITPSVPPGKLTVTAVSGPGLQVAFTNISGIGFTVMGSTNIALPLGQWQVLGGATESPAGQYRYIDTHATNAGPQFYLLRQP